MNRYWNGTLPIKHRGWLIRAWHYWVNAHKGPSFSSGSIAGTGSLQLTPDPEGVRCFHWSASATKAGWLFRRSTQPKVSTGNHPTKGQNMLVISYLFWGDLALKKTHLVDWNLQLTITAPPLDTSQNWIRKSVIHQLQLQPSFLISGWVFLTMCLTNSSEVVPSLDNVRHRVPTQVLQVVRQMLGFKVGTA